jgi:hypothetical protein
LLGIKVGVDISRFTYINVQIESRGWLQHYFYKKKYLFIDHPFKKPVGYCIIFITNQLSTFLNSRATPLQEKQQFINSEFATLVSIHLPGVDAQGLEFFQQSHTRTRSTVVSIFDKTDSDQIPASEFITNTAAAQNGQNTSLPSRHWSSSLALIYLSLLLLLEEDFDRSKVIIYHGCGDNYVKTLPGRLIVVPIGNTPPK